MNRRNWTRNLTRSVRIGAALTLLSAGVLVFVVFAAHEFSSAPFFVSLIVFQLSFIWTCAEILDGPDESGWVNDEPPRNDFTH